MASVRALVAHQDADRQSRGVGPYGHRGAGDTVNAP